MNNVKKLGRGLIWILLGLVLVGLVVAVAKLGLGLVLLAIDAWQGGPGFRSLATTTDHETQGRIVGYFLGQLIALLIMAFLWFKVVRWLRAGRPRINV